MKGSLSVLGVAECDWFISSKLVNSALEALELKFFPFWIVVQSKLLELLFIHPPTRLVWEFQLSAMLQFFKKIDST